MIEFLSSEDLGYIKKSLNSYETYCNAGEIEPLLSFGDNNYISELSMCGSLVYELRDLALEKISKVSGKNFLLNKNNEFSDKWKGNVSWYDWKYFLEWYNSKKKSI
jgi:hypothetical protein